MNYEEQIEKLAHHLDKAKRILFITGAGMSAESGLPTYRGIGGLYEDKLTEHNIPIEVALSGPMLEDRPEIVWQYIAKIEKATRGAKFNRGHAIVAKFESMYDHVYVLTQNVDGFHTAAGTKNIIDIHGDVHNLICTKCDYHEYVENYSHLEVPPKCLKCGSLIRPDVVLFGEMLPQKKTSRLQSELEAGFDTIFSIGTTSVFPYIAAPILYANANETLTVEINPGETDVSRDVDIKIRRGAKQTLEDVLSTLEKS